jgi:hypothetical protein
MGMLKDMQSQFAPSKTTANADTLAGEGKKNRGLEGLGEANASKYSVTEKRDTFAFEGTKLGLEGVADGSKFGLTGAKPTLYIDSVEF